MTHTLRSAARAAEYESFRYGCSRPVTLLFSERERVRTVCRDRPADPRYDDAECRCAGDGWTRASASTRDDVCPNVVARVWQ